MLRGYWFAVAAWIAYGLACSAVRADDFEADLLNRFQQQNKTAADKLKQQAAARLSEKSVEACKKVLDQLQQDTLLCKDERNGLIRKLQDRLRELNSQAQATSATADDYLARMPTKKPLSTASTSWSQASVREPKIQVKQAAVVLNTSAGPILVPDLGSREIAGYSYFADTREEYGTPILRGIPYLGRAFRNVGYSSFSGGMQISVSVRIINPQ